MEGAKTTWHQVRGLRQVTQQGSHTGVQGQGPPFWQDSSNPLNLKKEKLQFCPQPGQREGQNSLEQAYFLPHDAPLSLSPLWFLTADTYFSPNRCLSAPSLVELAGTHLASDACSRTCGTGRSSWRSTAARWRHTASSSSPAHSQ